MGEKLDELIEKCITEILGGAKDYHQEMRRALTKAIPIIQKAERERIMAEIEEDFEDEGNVWKLTIAKFRWQALKGEK